MSDNGKHTCKCSAKLTRASHLFLGEGQHILVLASGSNDRVLVKAEGGKLTLCGGRPALEVECEELFPRGEESGR